MSRSRRAIAAGATVAVLAAAGFGATEFGGRGATPSAAAPVARTTTVVRTDLAQTTPVNGTVGYASPVSIIEPAGTPSTSLTQAQQAAATAMENMTADQSARRDTNAADGQQVTQAQDALHVAQATVTTDASQLGNDEAALQAAQAKQANDCQGDQAAGAPASQSSPPSSGTACAADIATVTSDQQKVTSDQTKATQDQTAVQNAEGSVATAQEKYVQGDDQAKAKLATDGTALATAQAALATANVSATSYQATSRYTALPAVGQVVKPGQPLWSVDGLPVVLLPGAVPAWRSFAPGMADGPDVAMLDQALITLGDDGGLTPSDAYTDATAAAIKRLQASLGVPQTGVLPLGSVVFEPTAVRVTTVHPIVGAPVQGGANVLDVTSTTPVVNVALPVDQTYLVKVGDTVAVNLPDGSAAKGTVTAVGSVATNTTPSSGNGSNNPSATVNVTVSLTDPPPAGKLDQAPVTVEITNASAQGALAVKVGALLALAGGGYAVEVVNPDGTHHLVGVTTGIFDDQAGLVQVSGNGLAAGQTVVVAA